MKALYSKQAIRTTKSSKPHLGLLSLLSITPACRARTSLATLPAQSEAHVHTHARTHTYNFSLIVKQYFISPAAAVLTESIDQREDKAVISLHHVALSRPGLAVVSSADEPGTRHLI